MEDKGCVETSWPPDDEGSTRSKRVDNSRPKDAAYLAAELFTKFSRLALYFSPRKSTPNKFKVPIKLSNVIIFWKILVGRDITTYPAMVWASGWNYTVPISIAFWPIFEVKFKILDFVKESSEEKDASLESKIDADWRRGVVPKENLTNKEETEDTFSKYWTLATTLWRCSDTFAYLFSSSTRIE